MTFCILRIALDTPLNAVFDYRWVCDTANEPQVGQLALVPFGPREVVGLIVAVVLIAHQIVMIYVGSALWKFDGPAWLDGTAVYAENEPLAASYFAALSLWFM